MIADAICRILPTTSENSDNPMSIFHLHEKRIFNIDMIFAILYQSDITYIISNVFVYKQKIIRKMPEFQIDLSLNFK